MSKRKPVCCDVEMNFKHDAYFCKKCDKWLEKSCSDLHCWFCSNRPDKPSSCLGFARIYDPAPKSEISG